MTNFAGSHIIKTFKLCLIYTLYVSYYISIYVCKSIGFYHFYYNSLSLLICFYSHSKSPLQDIMNTPKFQMRKMQRQMIKERDYRDGLERELASKLALIAQRGTTFKCLCLDKNIISYVDKRIG